MFNKGTFRIFLLAESKWQRTPLSSSPKHKLGKTSWKINGKSQQSVTIKKHEVLNHSFSCCSSKPRPLITSENTDWLSSFCLIGISVPKCSHGREIKAWQLRFKKKKVLTGTHLFVFQNPEAGSWPDLFKTLNVWPEQGGEGKAEVFKETQKSRIPWRKRH